MRSTIYQRLIQYCEPESLPPQWQQVGLHVEAYRCPQQPARVIFELAWEFSIDDRVDSGIVHRGPDGLSISAGLSDPSGVFLVLRQSPAELPNMLLTAAGVINGDPPTMNSLRAAASHEFQLQPRRRVFIVFSMSDNLALHSIGLIALMIPGLADVDRGSLESLCQEFGCYSPENADFLAPNPDEPHALPQENTADSSTSNPGEIPRDHQSAQADNESHVALADLELIFVEWSRHRSQLTEQFTRLQNRQPHDEKRELFQQARTFVGIACSPSPFAPCSRFGRTSAVDLIPRSFQNGDMLRMQVFIAVVVTWCGLAVSIAAADRQPNIVIILADDIGYGDLGCYGATKVTTANLDRLAEQGMQFTDAHAPSAVCTPTRYAIMTGQYAWRHPPAARILSGVAPLCIDPGRATISSMLKRAGYTTGAIGKWHLGLGRVATDYNGEIKPGPRDVGFDYSFVIPATGDRTPCVYVENQRVVGYDPLDSIRVSYGEPIGSEPTGARNPELLKVKPSHGHDNTIINGISRIGYMSGGTLACWRDEEMAGEITRKAVGFIEQNKDRPFLLYFATHDVHVPRVPHARFRGTSQCGTRGDAIQELDWSVGEVMAAIDRCKLANNTLVIFSSDNGGVMDDGYQDGSGSDPSGHKCNGVLRGFKGGLYEGGTRVPLIARWPEKIPPGKTSTELVCLVDLFATFAAIAGAELAANAAPDSFNLLPALLAEHPERSCRTHLAIHGGNGGLSIRKGNLKLIPNRGNRQNKGAVPGPELYNLDDDIQEKRNLADQYPGKVKELDDLLEAIRDAGSSRAMVE